MNIMFKVIVSNKLIELLIFFIWFDQDPIPNNLLQMILNVFFNDFLWYFYYVATISR